MTQFQQTNGATLIEAEVRMLEYLHERKIHEITEINNI